jgi:protein tyrosine phosphatase (PTP) superfamily phosphohydrolase (DUF442 family)
MTNRTDKRETRRWITCVRRLLRIFLIVPALLALWALYLLATDNFHVVVEREAYRSGQMSSNELVRCIQRHQIRSIVNLRGLQPDQQWYREEVLAASAQNVVHRSIALSSRKPVKAEQMRELTAVLKNVPKPVLIHCDGGADRVAFAAAVYAAEIADTPSNEAEKEFSMWYGYWPFVWPKKAQLRESFRDHIRNRARERELAAQRKESGL